MIATYFKQAWQLLKQNPLFSSIYILGTGLSIAMILTLVIVYYIKLAPVYPELNRNRTLVAASGTVRKLESRGYNSSYLSYQTVSDFFYPLTNDGAEAVTAIQSTWGETPLVQFPGERGVQSVQVTYTDMNFWKVFTFIFNDGKPFTEADFESGLRTAVISQSTARKLYGEEDAIGRTFLLNDDEYKVCGVVRDASYITPVTFADIWVPYTVNPDIRKPSPWAYGYLGMLKVYILAKDKEAITHIKQVVKDKVQKVNASQKEYELGMLGYPFLYWKSSFFEFKPEEPDWRNVVKTFGTMILALLLVPALNLAGMISSRMERRLSELGVRKAFGASKGRLMTQVLVENLLLTCLGGLLGLVLSYGMVYTGRNWLPSLFARFSDVMPDGVDTFFTFDMLFNPTVFGITFGICLLLNLLSALIPAWSALRKQIVYSLNDKK